jgi:Family of unknown function (DUF6308)
MRHQLGISADDSAATPFPTIQDLVELVRQYLGGRFTGAAFDTYGQNDPCAVTADDLIAVTMLSIRVQEYGTAGIRPSAILELQAVSSEIHSQLSQLPADRELHTLNQDEFNSWLGPSSPGMVLFDLLRHRVSFPRVAVHKLLARKRPLLLPIRDTVVERALDLARPNDRWWQPWWLALGGDGAIVSQLSEIRRLAGTPNLSLLRIADIVIWLQNWPGRESFL